MLKVIAHPKRIQIVELLGRTNKLTVTEIYEALKMQQAVTSYHLTCLKNTGVLKVDKEGTTRKYYLAHPNLINILSCIDECLN